MANDDWQPSYPFNEPAVKDEVRAAIINEQRGLCVYCGRLLDLRRPGDSFHLEHFRPQHIYTAESVEYANMYISCGKQDNEGKPSATCGNKKDRWFDENQHVVPIYPDCVSRFRFFRNGKVAAAQDGDLSAERMIDVLNLNHPELVKDRADLLVLIDGEVVGPDDYYDSSTGTAQGYAHVVYQHHGMLLP